MWKEKLNVVDVYMTGCSLPRDTEKLQESKVKQTELSTNRMASASSQDLATNIDTVNIPWMMSNRNLYINEVAMQLERQEGGTQELLQRVLQGSDNLFDNLDILDMEFDGAELPQLPARSNIDSSMMKNISTYSSDLWVNLACHVNVSDGTMDSDALNISRQTGSLKAGADYFQDETRPPYVDVKRCWFLMRFQVSRFQWTLNHICRFTTQLWEQQEMLKPWIQQ